MEVILLDNCISSLPDEICELKELKFLSLLNNPNLKELPDCLNNLKNLAFIALTGSPNVRIPEWLKKRGKTMRKDDSNGNLWDLEYDK
jgi:leucine-rich repeat protein SHOC2